MFFESGGSGYRWGKRLIGGIRVTSLLDGGLKVFNRGGLYRQIAYSRTRESIRAERFPSKHWGGVQQAELAFTGQEERSNVDSNHFQAVGSHVNSRLLYKTANK